MIKSKLLLIASLFTLTACSTTRATYVPIVSVPAMPTDAQCVELFAQQPKRAAIRLGMITVDGNSLADWNDLVQQAKRQAAHLGGDFILVEDNGNETYQIQRPGFTSYTVSTDCGYYPITTGYSVGPRVETYNLPWATFAVYRYQPSHLGLRLDNNVVTGFHLNSDAPEAGVQPHDVLLGIDNFDLDDQELIAHMLTIQPNDPVTLTLQRNDQRLKRTITALKN